MSVPPNGPDSRVNIPLLAAAAIDAPINRFD